MNEMAQAGEHGPVRSGMRGKGGVPLQRRRANHGAFPIVSVEQALREFAGSTLGAGSAEVGDAASSVVSNATSIGTLFIQPVSHERAKRSSRIMVNALPQGLRRTAQTSADRLLMMAASPISIAGSMMSMKRLRRRMFLIRSL